jgi:hypothetical protein
MSTCAIDSLVLPKRDIHQRFRFRFIEMRDDRDNDEDPNSHENTFQTKPTSWDYQGQIRIEVKRVKIDARRNSTTPDFGEPKQINRAPKALLRRKNLSHEIDLVPTEELFDYGDKLFLSTSVKGGQVGIFIFRYSGVGMFERLQDEDSDTSEPQEPSNSVDPPCTLRDAYLVYGRQNLNDMATSVHHGKAKGEKHAHTESLPRSSNVNADRHHFGGLAEERSPPTTSQQWDNEDGDTAATVYAIHTDVAQARAAASLGPEAAKVPKLPPNEPVDFDEFGIPMEKLAQLDAFHKEHDALEAHIAGLKRQLEECEQGVGEVMKKQDELYHRLAERHSQTVAKLQADIDEDQRKVDSKKRKLDQMVERQAQLQSARRVRESLGEEI